MSSRYSAGVYNIGEAEIRHRKRTFGLGGLFLSIASFTILEFFNPILIYYSLLVIPVYISVIGFVQTKARFCAFYGAQGIQNMSDNVGNTQYIIGGLNRKKDKHKSRAIKFKSLWISIVITILLALVSKLLK